MPLKCHGMTKRHRQNEGDLDLEKNPTKYKIPLKCLGMIKRHRQNGGDLDLEKIQPSTKCL